MSTQTATKTTLALVGPLRDRHTLESRIIRIHDELAALYDMQEHDARDKRRIFQLRHDEAAVTAALSAGGWL